MLKKLLQIAASGCLVAGAASAADLSLRAAPPAFTAIPVFAWTGFYAGTLTGYGFSDRQTIRTTGNNDGSGGLTNTQLNVAQGRRPPFIRSEQEGLTSLGVNVGYDYQLRPGAGLVIGAATDFALTNLDRRRGYASPAQAAYGFNPDGDDRGERQALSNFRQRLGYFGTVRGRVGYAFDRLLVYGTGGFAYGEVDYRAAFLRTTDLAVAYAGRFNRIETGYVYGGGVEYALPTDSFLSKLNVLSLLGIQSAAVTVKAEYLRYDLGSRNVLVSAQIPGGPTGSYTSRFTTEGSIVRGGFTYRFGGL